MVAVTNAALAWLTVASLLGTTVVAAFVAAANFRRDTKTTETSSFTAMINGMKALADERQEELERVEAEVRALHAEVRVATGHVVECERDLAHAFARIRALEEAADGS